MHSGTKFGYFQFILSSENCKTYTKIRFVSYTQSKEGTKTIHKHKKPSEFEAWGNALKHFHYMIPMVKVKHA